MTSLDERERVTTYLEQRAERLRSVQPDDVSMRIADALEAEARRIRRGDHLAPARPDAVAVVMPADMWEPVIEAAEAGVERWDADADEGFNWGGRDPRGLADAAREPLKVLKASTRVVPSAGL